MWPSFQLPWLLDSHIHHASSGMAWASCQPIIQVICLVGFPCLSHVCSLIFLQAYPLASTPSHKSFSFPSFWLTHQAMFAPGLTYILTQNYLCFQTKWMSRCTTESPTAWEAFPWPASLTTSECSTDKLPLVSGSPSLTEPMLLLLF